MIYVVEPGQNGQGIQVREGDHLVVPSGAMLVSLDRMRSAGRFTRAGLAWFASVLLHAGAPETPDNLSELLDHYLATCKSVLRHSESLTDLDLTSEAGMRAALERMNNADHLRGSIEHWALALGVILAQVVESLDRGDAERTAWAMNRLTNAHAMLVFKRDLEAPLWRGYLTDGLREILQIWQTNKDNDKEEFWQRTLGEHPLILSQAFATPIVILNGKAYVGGKGYDNRGGMVVDFLMSNPLSKNVAFVEIKTPKTPLLSKTPYRKPGVYAVHAQISGAIVQVQAQRDSFVKGQDGDEMANQRSTFNPQSLVIAGNLQSEMTDAARRRSFELFRQGLRDVQIVTFDELFNKIEILLKLLESP